MSAELFDHIAQFIKEVGGPTALSFGLLAILWQQTGILKGIRDSLDRLHGAVTNSSTLAAAAATAAADRLSRKDSPSHDTTAPSLRTPRPARSHQG